MELGGADGPGGAGGVMAPIAAQADEPAYTKKKVADFLNHHTGAAAWGAGVVGRGTGWRWTR